MLLQVLSQVRNTIPVFYGVVVYNETMTANTLMAYMIRFEVVMVVVIVAVVAAVLMISPADTRRVAVVVHSHMHKHGQLLLIIFVWLFAVWSHLHTTRTSRLYQNQTLNLNV